MLNKVGIIIFKKSSLPKIKLISSILFILSFFFLITFPYWQENIYINEKQMKVSEIHSNDFSESDFSKNYKLLSNLMQNKSSSDYVNYQEYIQNLFKNKIKLRSKIFKISNDDTQLLTYRVISQRGDRMRSNMINFIYDSNKPLNYKNLILLYCFLDYFQTPEKTRWLAKDLYINILSSDLFYNKPAKLNKFLKKERFFNQSKKDFILNLDVNIELSPETNFIINYSGANSETVDMDYYKMIYDNLLSHFHSNKISANYNNRIIDFNNYVDKAVSYFGNITDDFKFIQPYSRVVSSKFDYRKEMIYTINNIYSTFLIPFKIDSNHLFVSEGINSITLKAFKNTNELNEQDKYSFTINLSLIKILENIMKGLSIVEIDIFRGNYHYIFTSNYSFVGILPFLLIPVLAVLRLLFEGIELFYNKNIFSKANKPGYHLCLYVLIHMINITLICNVKSLIGYNYELTNNELIMLIIGIILISYLVLITLTAFTKERLRFYNITNLYFQSIMCFNYFFINYGLGLLWVLFIYSNEGLSILLISKYYTEEEKDKKTIIKLIIKLMLSIGILYFIFMIDMSTIFQNYIYSRNNVFPIVCSGLNILLFKVAEEIVIIKRFLI